MVPARIGPLIHTTRHPRKPDGRLSRRTAFIAPLLLIVVTASAVVAPMFFLGNASGHDFQFHLASWMDTAGQWREGIFYPRWAEWANWGFGEPRFIFYPPASWMMGALLGTIFPWSFAPIAFLWLTLIAGGMSMWKLAREWLPGKQAAIAALFFVLNAYHLVIVYYRSDFAELLAGALLPLLVWAALRVSMGGSRTASLRPMAANEPRSDVSGIPILAVIFAGIWLCNAPAAVIATYSLVLLLVVGRRFCAEARGLSFWAGSRWPVDSASPPSIFFPRLREQRWVQIGEALTRNLHPAQNFLFTHSNDPEFLLFNLAASGAALGVMLVAGIAAIFSARKRGPLREIWWMCCWRSARRRCC